MPKNWRGPVCTRWRPLVYLIIGFFVTLSFFVITVLIDKHLLNELNRKGDRLEMGMTKEELIEIMGEPAFTHTINVADLKQVGFPPQDVPDEVRKEHRHLVEYGFITKRMPWSRSVHFISGIYLDEGHKTIVMLEEGYDVGVMDFYGIQQALQRLICIGILAVAIVIAIVMFRLWCKKKLKNHSS